MINNKYMELYEIINSSNNFQEVKASGLLPEPDADDGYYFVSYSHKDYKKVIKDIIEFQERGNKIWYDRGLESGKSWIKEVKQKMSSYYCKGIIFYLSKNYFLSESCMLELSHFLEIINKSCIFITLDEPLDEEGKVIENALDKFNLPGAVMLDVAMLVNSQVEYDEEIDIKAGYLSSFLEPDLIEYTFMSGIDSVMGKVADMFLGKYALVSGIKDKNIKKIEIPEFVYNDGKKYKVIGIASNSFIQCELLEEVVMGNNWLVIGKNAFVRCPSLKRVKLGLPYKLFGKRNGSVDDSFLHCPQAKFEFEDESVVYNSAFKNRDDLIEMKHDKSVRWGGECFFGCDNLKKVELDKGDLLGDRMFMNCSSLETIIVPKNNSTIVISETFKNCSKLKNITLPNNIMKIGIQTFMNCSSLEEINIPKKVYSIHLTSFENCSSLKKVVFDSTNFKYLKNIPYKKKLYIDTLFPFVKEVYFKKIPKNVEMFKDEFVQCKSDKKGYSLFKRRDV